MPPLFFLLWEPFSIRKNEEKKIRQYLQEYYPIQIHSCLCQSRFPCYETL